MGIWISQNKGGARNLQFIQSKIKFLVLRQPFRNLTLKYLRAEKEKGKSRAKLVKQLEDITTIRWFLIRQPWQWYNKKKAYCTPLSNRRNATTEPGKQCEASWRRTAWSFLPRARWMRNQQSCQNAAHGSGVALKMYQTAPVPRTTLSWFGSMPLRWVLSHQPSTNFIWPLWPTWWLTMPRTEFAWSSFRTERRSMNEGHPGPLYSIPC